MDALTTDGRIVFSGTPVPIAEREQAETKPWLNVRISDGTVVDFRRQTEGPEPREEDTSMREDHARPIREEDILRAVIDEGITQRQAAKRFGIALTEVNRCLKRAVRKGTIINPERGIYLWANGAKGTTTEKTVQQVTVCKECEKLTKQVDHLRTGVEAAEAQVHAQTRRLDLYQERIAKLEEMIDRLAAEIARLQQDKLAGDHAERALRIVEALVLGAAERRPVA